MTFLKNIRLEMLPREIFEQQYKAAAAEGAIYELRIRLLADKTPKLQQSACAERLEDVETLIAEHFTCVLSEEEKTILKLSRQLRNKILHCDFRAAREKLGQLGIETGRGEVKKVDIRDLTGLQMAEKITGVIHGVPHTFDYVADAAAGAGSVYGWLLEVGQAGDFNLAIDVFARAGAIVDRLATRYP